MKTVMQVVQHLRPGGIETLALDLQRLSHPEQAGYIVSLEGKKSQALQAWPRLQPYADKLIFLNKHPGVDYAAGWQLLRLFKRLRVDVVHTHHIGPLVYAGLAARLARVKTLVHTEHDAWHLTHDKQCQLQRRVIRVCKPTIVADAEHVAGGMKKYLNMWPDCIIRNGIDTEKFSPGCQQTARAHFGLPSQARMIGCSGRLEREKGQAYLIAAIAQLPSHVHVVLAGNGSLQASLMQQAEALKLRHRVHFLGHIDEMPTFYQCLDVFCQPSVNEGMPLAPLEAQACGIPAVVTTAGGARESLCPDTGKMVSLRNARALAEAISALLEPESKNPRRFITQQADIKTTVSAYEKLYQGASVPQFMTS